jgi:hypothetical protein
MKRDCIAGFFNLPVQHPFARGAGWKVGDTAGWKACAAVAGIETSGLKCL